MSCRHHGGIWTVTDAVGTRTMKYDAYLQFREESYDSASLYGAKLLSVDNYETVTYAEPGGGGMATADFWRVTRIAYGTSAAPEADYVAHYSFDPDTDRVTQATGPGLPTKGANYVYLANSSLIQRIDFKNNSSTLDQIKRQYKAKRDLVKSVENLWNAQQVSKYAYAYDSLARRTSVVYTRASAH